MTIFQDFTNDIAYCIQYLGCNHEETDELIGCADDMGLSVQYFCEEFIFGGDSIAKYHDEDYLSIDAFNTIHGIYFEEVE